MNLGIVALKYVWAAPNSLVGLLIGLLSLVRGAKFSIRSGVIEIYGPGVAQFLNIGIPGIGGMPALTLGHVILAQDAERMEQWRAHERVHVGQYEWLGPLFLPAYAVSAIAAWCVGKDPYYENPFERQAYSAVAEPQRVPSRERRGVRGVVVAPVVIALRQSSSGKAA